MAFITDSAFDAALDYVRNNAENLYLCSQEPTTVAEANSTYKIATKASPSIAAPSDRSGGGRKCTVSAITDGTVNATGTGTHWALVKDSATAELLATGQLDASQAFTSGNEFTLTAFDFGILDAVNSA